MCHTSQVLAAKLGLASTLIVAFRLGRREVRLLHNAGALPAARLRPTSARDRLRLARASAADLSHALSVAVGLASLAGTAVAVAIALLA